MEEWKKFIRVWAWGVSRKKLPQVRARAYVCGRGE
jgi:hypothetical protein